MPDDPAPWTLKLFLERFDAWVEQEDFSGEDCTDLRAKVLNWVVTRHGDPYRGVRPEPIPGLYYGPVPQARVGNAVVTCSYWIKPVTREVVCHLFGLTSPPVWT